MLYYMNWLTHDFWTRTGGWEFDRSHGTGTSSQSYWQLIEEQAPKPVGWMMCFLLKTFVPVQKLCANIYIYIYAFSIWVLFSLVYQLCLALWWKWFNTRLLVTLVFFLKNTMILGIWCSTIPHLPGCFLPGPSFGISDSSWCHRTLYVTSSYSTWISCMGASGFATDCHCDVWCCRLTTYLLHVGSPFRNRFLYNSWALGLT